MVDILGRDFWCCGGKRKSRRVSLVLPTDDGPYNQLEVDEPKQMPATTKCGVCALIISLLVGSFLLLGIFLSFIAPEAYAGARDMITDQYSDVVGWLTGGSEEVCEDGLFIPGPQETRLNVMLFMALLLWSFIGVSNASDIFMVAIETITSKETTKTVVINGEPKKFTVTVWNATVANLTLMALGSSAPEILLSMIEIGSSGFYAGELGPSTIVGSAAYNLMVISAVCVMAIPAGQGRLIKDVGVFAITACFSVGAYLWLILILQVWTPNIVDVWEGVVTLLFFPILVGLAYGADMNWPCFNLHSLQTTELLGLNKHGKPVSKSDIAKVAKTLGDGIHVVDSSAAGAALSSALKPRSRAFYRVQAVRSSVGQKTPQSSDESIHNTLSTIQASTKASGAASSGSATVEFSQAAITIRESEPYVSVAVTRTGGLFAAHSVFWQTVGVTATAGEDFEYSEGRLFFKPGQRTAKCTVKLFDDDVVEDDEIFQVVLSDPSDGCKLGKVSKCDVKIEDDDGPGQLAFETPSATVAESDPSVTISVKRIKGSDGTVSVKWATKENTAVSPSDFIAGSGTLTFGPGVVEQRITVNIIDDGRYERDEDFLVILTEPSGGAMFAAEGDGDSERQVCTVTITSDDKRSALVDSVSEHLDLNVDNIKLAASSWSEQFVDAVRLDEEYSVVAICLYILALPWKLAFAIVPPPRLMGGWLCFGVALIGIGLLTALIGDLASHMGCCMGLIPSVTAITFVALGTSLPDTFASKSAAEKEPYADNSIGNITGSNSVNVFLGLGLPWASAAIFWSKYGAEHEDAWRAKYQDADWYVPGMPIGFAVPAGDLAYSVSVFSTCAVVTISILVGRRYKYGYELGGPAVPKVASASFMILLWLVYITLSTLKSYQVDIF